MRIFYHCLIMWVPFVVLFAFAGLGLEILEGNKISTTEYGGISDFGPLFYLFIWGSLALVFYVVSFLPLTFIVNKFVESLLLKVVIFTFTSGVIAVFVFEKSYSSRFIEEYNLSMISAIIIFSVAGLLYSFIEYSVKKNINFI